MLGFIFISLSNKTGIVIGIVFNLQTGEVRTFDDYGMFFWALLFHQCSFFCVIASVNGVIFLISLLNRSLLLYKN